MPPANPGALRLRVLSALVLAPLALAAVWVGGGWLLGLIAAAVLGMGWEWARLCGRGQVGATGVAIIVTPLAALATLVLGSPIGWVIALGGALITALIAGARGKAEPLWAGGGILWIALGANAFFALWRIGGRPAIFLLLAVVWASDIGAYAAGRTLGGPRLAPRISPNKTWAGFFGGLIGAGLVGTVWAVLANGPSLPGAALFASCLSLAAQIGDLAESFAKRHFGVKDSSGLIPGHGGLLDRLDGLLTAAMAMVAYLMAIGVSS